MAIVVVEVMPKKELLDPAGKTVLAALKRMTFPECEEVRVGKRFELHLDGHASDELLSQAEKAAKELLANETIEDIVSIRVEADRA